MMFQQVASVSLALAAIQLAGLAIDQANAFPSLFNRGSLFRRTNGQQQASKQQQQQQQPGQSEQLVPLANSAAPISFQHQQAAAAAAHFGQLQPAELMRLSGLDQQLGAHPLHHLARQQQQQAQSASLSIPFSSSAEPIQLVDSSAQAAAYYKSNVAPPMQRQPQLASSEHQRHESEQASLQPTFDLYDNSAAVGYLEAPEAGEAQPLKPQAARAHEQKAREQQMHLEPTHTSEVVDKIEQHIDKQIERGMAEHDSHLEEKPAARQAAASGYHHAHKEAAASGEAEEVASEAGEPGASEEKAEKRAEGSEPEMKEEKEEHHQHQHHHHEHAPEAFEIHHKKGGKSFQYFHQGHSH